MKNKQRSVCPVACTLDIIGDKWSLLIVRDLILGCVYFKDFLASPEGIATNILTDRLNRLTESGIIKILPDSATVGRNKYILTEKGEGIRPIIETIADWGLNYISGTSKKLKPI